MRRRLRTVTIVVVLTCLILSTSARAEKAGLTDIVVTNTMDHLLVYFSVTDCFTEDVVKAIEKEIADFKVKHDIQYDNLKRVYNVRLSERDNKLISVKNFDEAKTLMSEIVGLEVCELHRLRKGSRYKVSMMAELDKIRLPLHLHYVFFFLSLWDFETDWYTMDFKY
ncbi:MAG: DUF4390 domain-containing protein [Deltaproteobacteria bacterium]|nr:DUF4390 domain-containing protein [Deltaproteobacteria bacterium]